MSELDEEDDRGNGQLHSFTVPLKVTQSTRVPPRVPKCSFSQRDQAVFFVMVIDAADAWKLLLLERRRPSFVGPTLVLLLPTGAKAPTRDIVLLTPNLDPTRFKGSMLTPCQLSTIREEQDKRSNGHYGGLQRIKL